MKILVAMLYTSLSFVVYCQQNIDSLENVWSNTRAPSSERLKAKEKLIKASKSNYPANFVDEVNSYISFAKKNNQRKHELRGYQNVGLYYFKSGLYKKAHANYEKSLTFIDKNTIVVDIVQGYNGLASSNQALGKYSNATTDYLKSWDLIKDTEFNRAKTVVLGNLGNLYLHLEKYEEALEVFDLTLRFFKQNEDTKKIVNAYLNLGAVHGNLKDYTKSFAYYDTSVSILKAQHNIPTLCSCYLNMTSVALNMTDTLKAKLYLEKAINAGARTANKLTEAKSLFYEAIIQSDDRSIPLAKEALELAIEMNSEALTSEFANYLYLEYKIKKMDTEALEMYELSVQGDLTHENEEALIEILKYKNENTRKETEDRYKKDISTSKSSFNRVFIYLGSLIIIVSLTLIWFWLRLRKGKKQKNELLEELERIRSDQTEKSKMNNFISSSSPVERVELFDNAIAEKLNPSDLKVINELFNNPTISNKELADNVALSVEGTRSSLKKMYRIFDIPSSRNMKLALVLRIVQFQKQEK